MSGLVLEKAYYRPCMYGLLFSCFVGPMLSWFLSFWPLSSVDKTVCSAIGVKGVLERRIIRNKVEA